MDVSRSCCGRSAQSFEAAQGDKQNEISGHRRCRFYRIAHCSHVARAGTASVRVLDNFSTGKRENLEDLTRQFNRDQFEVFEGDLRDASRVEEAVRGVEVIFHEAAFVSVLNP